MPTRAPRTLLLVATLSAGLVVVPSNAAPLDDPPVTEVAVASPPEVEAPPVEVATIDAAIAAGIAHLLDRQEGDARAEWPYQGVYRVPAETDDPESLVEGQGRRRSVIPIGYRVGGTSIAASAVLRPAGIAEDEARRAAIERARRFVVASTAHPRMTPDFAGGYDVRGWGYIYGLRFLLEVRERGLVSEDAAAAHDAAIRFYIDGLAQIEIPEVGGWNYARRGPLDRRDATSPFMTPPGVQALREATRQGFEVPDGLVERAMIGLDLTRGDEGHVAYAAQRPTTEPPTQIPGAIGRMVAVETVRSELDRNDADDLRRALAAFVTHWDELLKRKEKTGTHQPPYGVAPYYFMFAHGFAAEAIERLPDGERAAWRDRLQRLLLSVRDGDDGTWNDRVFPRSSAYGTAIAILALTQPAESSRERGTPPPPAPPVAVCPVPDASPTR